MNNVKKSIGWADFTINPVKGLCPMHCKTPDGYEYCYAAGERGLYKRFKWNPTIRYDPRAWLGLRSLRKPARIFVGSTMELFHDSLSKQYLKWIFEVPLEFPQHTFIFLTKQPANLARWSPFPGNAWVGVTATGPRYFAEACNYLRDIEAPVKFLSIEPYLKEIIGSQLDTMLMNLAGISWLVIGQQTPISARTQPRPEWIDEIEIASRKAGIPYFEKNNLKSLLGRDLVQDYPRGVVLDH